MNVDTMTLLRLLRRFGFSEVAQEPACEHAQTAGVVAVMQRGCERGRDVYVLGAVWDTDNVAASLESARRHYPAADSILWVGQFKNCEYRRSATCALRSLLEQDGSQWRAHPAEPTSPHELSRPAQ
jgi:hypothetical protein